MPNPKYAAYESANPYFDLVRGALGNLVDGERSSTSSLTASSTGPLRRPRLGSQYPRARQSDGGWGY
jgi:hypothetical protein